ncbi:MAG: thiamine phosphate synthase, partial [Planctomycetia bacterium]
LRLDDVVDRMDAARIVDANANRAREALRVMEDYARFVLEDRELGRTIKELRHELRDALGFLPAHWLTAARDAVGDVGATVDAADEHHRRDLPAVAVANCKRAQEALRSMEECAKLESVAAAMKLERLRYRLYTVEKRLTVLGRSADLSTGPLAGRVLYWLIDPNECAGTLDWMIAQGAAGGVGVVQLRDKRSSDRELLDVARAVRRYTREAGVLFIVNDRPDLARLVRADGVHVGQDDLPVREVRRLVGPDLLVGVSTHTIEQAREATAEGADYIGVGPVFPSKTKSFTEFPGLAFVRQVAEEIMTPAYCIGGVTPENTPTVVAAGGARVAVAGALSSTPEPSGVARAFRAALGG